MAPGKRSREILERALDAEKAARGRYELDPDTLECPICTEPLCPPVLQSLNGHTSCSSCSKKLAYRCPSCSQPIGSNRCFAVEKILELLQYCGEIPESSSQQNIDYCVHLLGSQTYTSNKVQTVELDSSRKMQLRMKSTDYLMLLRIDSELLVIHHEVVESLGDIFFCSSFGEIPNKLFYLKVEPKNEAKYHTMRTGVRDIGLPEEWSDFLLVPYTEGKSRAINCQFDMCLNEVG